MRIHIIGIIAVINAGLLFAQAPVVENVRFEQRTDGSLMVDIYYDVFDAANDPVDITIEASNDNGETWDLLCVSLNGDAGSGIVPGPGKHVVWDFYRDHPNLNAAEYRIRVKADDHVLTDIDGNRYEIVQIGDQVWMAENLKVSHYRNGDEIPFVSNAYFKVQEQGAIFLFNPSPAPRDNYMYNWYAVNDERGLAPEGWHVPTDDDWNELAVFLGMDPDESDIVGWQGTDEGAKLKALEMWKASPTGSATNETGFSALPTGTVNTLGQSGGLGYKAVFWSSTSAQLYPNSAKLNHIWIRQLHYDHSQILREATYYISGLSVRCVKDRED